MPHDSKDNEDLSGPLEASPAEMHYRVVKDPKRPADDHSREFGMRQRVGLAFGPLAFLLMLVIPTPEGMSPEAQCVAAVALLMATWWISEAIPIHFRKRIFVMDWEWASKLPWGVLILFGGGLALADGFQSSSLATWIVGTITVFDQLPLFAVVVCVTALVIFLTELTSNTATSTMLMPVLAGVAIGLGESPLILLAPAALAASCAFMLPVATPPNAIVFGSGHVTIPQMVRSGFALNIIGIVLIPLCLYFLFVPVFEIVIGELPAWAR